MFILYLFIFSLPVDLVPDDHSIILRYIIETLFILHCEPKLNMICPVSRNPDERYARPYNLVWCAHLNHPSNLSNTPAI